MKDFWIAALLLLLATSAQATQVFSHDTGRVRWEAEVTESTFALREKTDASAGSEFVCPLGPAVRASVVRTGADTGRVCLVFSRDKCAYKGVGGAPAATSAPSSGVATFKCVDFATAEQASVLAALINAGPRTHIARSPASSKGPAVAARPRAVGPPGTASQKGSPTPVSSASGSGAASNAGQAAARKLARVSAPADVEHEGGSAEMKAPAASSASAPEPHRRAAETRGAAAPERESKGARLAPDSALSAARLGTP